jgi:asparagine synthase (glutamine-hydrolysing)
VCGIVAWIDNTISTAADSEAIVKAMRDTLAHRGPDDAGLKRIDNVVLAQRRLSIIDLSPLGHQPMSTADGRLWITFNGEIYNYADIRQQLEAAGTVFKSTSDTEVLLYAYRANPTGFLHQLEGMFSLVLYDADAHRVVIARDRFGEKPFYYTYQPGQHFGVASEQKALVAHPAVSRAWSPEGICLFEHLGFVPAPHTAFKAIQVLPAGHWAILDTQALDWIQPPTAYWTLPAADQLAIQTVAPSVASMDLTHGDPLGPVALAATFEQKLDASVRLRRVADVPVGVLLSGGLDSSTIATLAQSQALAEGLDPIDTFTVQFDSPVLDESAKAQVVANHLETQHHVVVCTAERFWQTAQTLLPTLDSLNVEHLVPMALVAELAREHVTVVLSGDGADEALGGYNGYRVMEQLQQIEAFGAHSWMPPALQGLLNAPIKPDRKRQWHRVAQYFDAPKGYGYVGYRYAHTLAHLTKTLGQPLFNPTSPFAQARQSSSGDFWSLLGVAPIERWNDALRFDCQTNMAQSILMKSDTMTMQHGVELRCPFLDSDLFTWLYQLPVSVKRKQGASKALLREFLQVRGYPQRIWNQSKAGFMAPFGYWVKTLPWFAQAVEDTILEQSARSGLGLRPEAVAAMRHQHRESQADHSHGLWALVILSAWANTYGQASAPVAMPQGALR